MYIKVGYADSRKNKSEKGFKGIQQLLDELSLNIIEQNSMLTPPYVCSTLLSSQFHDVPKDNPYLNMPILRKT